jgi:uncharacterized membrane protein
LDSLLGATVQASYYDTSKGQVWNSLPSSPARQRNFKRIAGRWEVLSNNQVNAISSALTATTAAVKILNLAKI